MPFGGQVPAVQEELDLIRRERPDHEDIGLGGQRAGEAVGPGGDHEVVARVGGDLPLDPVGHGEAVVGAGDLIKAVEQDQAPAAAQLALPPAAWFLARPRRRPRPVRRPAARSPGRRRSTRPARAARAGWGRACGPGVRATAGLGAAAGRVGEQGALAASRRADEREDHARAAVEELADRVPLRGVLGRPAERVTGRLVRGPADQRDVDVDLAQLRDVVTAGREILHVDVPERVKHPPPVPVAVARERSMPAPS